MEYFLNSCWLLLFVPAFWVWRRQVLSIGQGRPRSLACLVSLVCVVFLLFPVISASDDLHPMRPEMEESSSSKRAFRQAPDQHASAQCHFAPLTTRVTPALVVLPPDEASSWDSHQQEWAPAWTRVGVLASRAPPSLFPF